MTAPRQRPGFMGPTGVWAVMQQSLRKKGAMGVRRKPLRFATSGTMPEAPFKKKSENHFLYLKTAQYIPNARASWGQQAFWQACGPSAAGKRGAQGERHGTVMRDGENGRPNGSKKQDTENRVSFYKAFLRIQIQTCLSVIRPKSEEASTCAPPLPTKPRAMETPIQGG